MTDDYLLPETAETIGRLRASWSWLAASVEPGRGGRASERVLAEGQLAEAAARLRGEVLADVLLFGRASHRSIAGARRSAVLALVERLGLSDAAVARRLEVGPLVTAWRELAALAPVPAAASPGILAAQASVRRLVTEVARAVAAARGASFVGGSVPATLDWLDGTDRALWVASPAGVLTRTPPMPGELRVLRDAWAAALARRKLARADEVARAAVGVVEDVLVAIREPIVVDRQVVGYRPAACPACGRRSLQGDATAPDDRGWTVRCVRAECRCTGVGCWCLRKVRPRGGEHVWSRGEFRGPYSLAEAVRRAGLRRER